MQQQQRNIRLLWLAQVISSAGDAIYQIALLWLVFDITGSSTITGLIAMAAFMPAMLFGLYAGVVADKYSRKLIMIFSNLSQALTVIIIPVMLCRPHLVLPYTGNNNSITLGCLVYLANDILRQEPIAISDFG